jgi:hypothetical protein
LGLSKKADRVLCARQVMPVLAAANSAAERVGLNEAWVLRNLKRNALVSMRNGDRAAANRSIELIGKHLGIFIESSIWCRSSKAPRVIGRVVLQHLQLAANRKQRRGPDEPSRSNLDNRLEESPRRITYQNELSSRPIACSLHTS